MHSTSFTSQSITGNERYEKKSLTFFEAGISLSQKRDIGAFLGRAAYHERQGNPARALEDINFVVASFPYVLHPHLLRVCCVDPEA